MASPDYVIDPAKTDEQLLAELIARGFTEDDARALIGIVRHGKTCERVDLDAGVRDLATQSVTEDEIIRRVMAKYGMRELEAAELVAIVLHKDELVERDL
jgi:hypothetical protein